MKRPFLNIFIPFASGIAAGYFISAPLWVSVSASAVFAALFFLFSRKKLISHFMLYGAIFLFGMACYQNSVILPADHISNITPDIPEKIFLRGKVMDDPVVETTFYHKERTGFTISVSEYKKGAAWRSARGLVKVDQYSDRPASLKYGDEMTAEGLLYRPAGLENPGLFNYADYLAIRGIYSVFKIREKFPISVNADASAGGMRAFAYRIRNSIRGVIDRYMEYPYAGFIKAIIIGDRSELPDHIKDDFIRTGTVHIIAISGLNLGIIAAIILAILGILGIPKRINLVLTLLAIGVYSVTAGSSPPVIRASIVFAVYVIGYVIRRDADMLNSLSIAGFLILLYNPRELFDPSFQLSFGSVACIIIFTPYIENLMRTDKIGRRSAPERTLHYLLTGFAVSLAAWAGTWPIVATYFNIVSPISIAANLLIVPALFVLTVGAFAFLCTAFFSSTAAVLTSAVVQQITVVTFFMNDLFAKIPFGYFRIGSPKIWFIILYYVFLASFLMPDRITLRYVRIRKATIILAMLIFANIFIWRDAISITGGKTCLAFLDVGHGDSALIELPSGGKILVDGGTGGAGRFDAGKNVIAPYLWNRGIRRLDAVVVTHFHDDHMGGILYILENFKVDAVIDNGGQAAESMTYRRYLSILKKRDIRRIIAGEGDLIKIGGAQLFVLNPEKGKIMTDPNDDSIVMKLVSGDTSVLFCGDVQEGTIKRLMGYGNFLQSNIVKVPHHGSSLGSEETVRNFFEVICPTIAVISVGKLNHYGKPSKSVSNVITDLNIRSYETKDGGAVIICRK